MGGHDRRHRTTAAAIGSAVVFIIALGAYVALLPSGVGIGDDAEAQTVPYILGIAHPTGFPVYTLAGWLFAHALAFGSVAWRLNAFTAVATATSAVGVFLLAIVIGGELVVAGLTALAFAFGTGIWNGALHANAQSLAATFSIFALLGSITFARSGDRRALIAASTCCGFGLATHPSSIWVVPAIVTAIAWHRSSMRMRAIGLTAAALIFPLAIYAYLPLRSAIVATHGLDPAAGLSLDGASHVDWDMNTPRTLTGFLDEVLGRNEGAAGSLTRAFDPHAIPDALRFWFELARTQFGIIPMLFAATGVVALARLERRALSVIAAGTAGGIAFAYVYRTDMHIDRYMIVSFAAAAAIAASATRMNLIRIPRSLVSRLVVAALAVNLAWNIVANRPATTPPAFADGQTIIAAVQHDIPDGAVVVSQWNDATALGYGAFIEHALGSRIIVSAWPWQYDRQYPAWLRSHQVFLLVSPFSRWGKTPVHVRLHRVPSSIPTYDVFVVRPLSKRSPVWMGPR
jgi:hypothetical protein